MQGQTALHAAAAQGSVPCVRLLQHAGADAGLSTEAGWTAAHYAAQANE